jgi:hypothetical protein
MPIKGRSAPLAIGQRVGQPARRKMAAPGIVQ